MKVLYISSSTIPSQTANSVQVMKMCDALSKSGHDVVLLAFKGFYTQSLFHYYNVNNSFDVKVVGSKRVIISVLFFVFNLMKFKPDLVYSRNLYGSCIASLLGFPVYLEIHDDRWRRGRIAPYLYKYLNRSCCLSKVIFITNNLMRIYRKDWPYSNCKSFQVLPDAAELPKFYEQKVDIVPTEENRMLSVGYVGGLYEGKGLEVVEHIAPRLNDVMFHIVGGTGEQLKYWETKINYPNVRFYGYVEQNSIAKLYEGFDICLLPNQKKSHGVGDDVTNISSFTSPLKLFEYMSYKKAIIASNLAVFREILHDGINCILVEPDSWDGWVGAINLLKDEHLRGRLQTSAYDEFVKNYTWDKRVEKLFQNSNN